MSDSLPWKPAAGEQPDGGGLAKAILLGGVGSGGAMLLLSAAIVGFMLFRGSPQQIVESPPPVTPIVQPGETPAEEHPPEPAPPSAASGSFLPPVNLQAQFGQSKLLLRERPMRVEGGEAVIEDGFTNLGPPQTRIDAIYDSGQIAGPYQLHAWITRLEGTGGVLFHLPVRTKTGTSRMVTVAIDHPHSPEPVSGLLAIDRQPLTRAEFPRAVRGSQLTDGKKHDLWIAVLEDRIVAVMDGQTLIDWSGDFSLLGSNPRSGGTISVSNLGAAIRFDLLRLKPIVSHTITPPTATVVEGAAQVASSAGTSNAGPMPPTPVPPSNQGKVLPAVNLDLQLGDSKDLLVRGAAPLPPGVAFPAEGAMELGFTGRYNAASAGVPSGNFLIDARVQRTGGSGGVQFHIPVKTRAGGTRMISLAIDQPGGPEPKSGLLAIRNWPLVRAEYPRAVAGSRLADGQPHDVRIAVLDGRIVMQFDGQTLVDWTGDGALLSSTGEPYFGVAVGSVNASLRLERLRLYPIENYKISPEQAAVVEGDRVAAVPGTPGTNPPGTVPPGTRPPGAVAPYSAPPLPLDKLDIKVGPPVDLLGGVRPTVREGQISTAGSTLTTSPAGICKAEFVYRLPEAYVVEGRVKRNTSVESLVLSLMVGGRACAVVIDGWPAAPGGPFTGLDMVDGRRLPDNPTKVQGPHLKDGEAADLRIVVFSNRVIAQIDGRTIFDWTGDPAQLSQATGYRVGAPIHLGVATYQASYTVEKLVVHRITGVGAAAGQVAGTTSAPEPDPQPPGATNVAGSRNLLAGTTRNVHAGSPTQVGTQLLTNDGEVCKIEFEYPLPPNYTIDARVTRLGKLDALGFNILVGGTPCTFVIDGWANSGGPCTGLDMLDGRRTRNSPLAVKGQQLEDNKAANFRLSVEQNRVRAEIDGKPVFDHEVDPAKLARHADYAFGQPQNLGIWAYKTQYRIESLVVLTSPSGSPPPPSLASLLAKQPVPDDDAQQPVREKMSSVFGEAIAKAKRPDERAKLAREFAEVAKTEKDATTRYVLLQAARKMAISGLDAALAVELSDSIGKQFEVEELALRLESLQQVAAAAGTNTEAHKKLAELAAALGEETLDSERYDVADEASKLAADAAGKARDADLRRQTKELRDDVLAEKKAWETAEAALARLEESPDDAAAHLAAGRYYAFSRDDWPKALPHLAASNDPALADAAKAEAGAEGAAAQLAAADKWYDAAAAAPAADKATLQRHARDLYEAALPQLTGLDQIKATRRRDELKAAVEEAEKTQSAAARTATRRSKSVAAMEPGLIVRTYRGDPPRSPSHLLSIVNSSDEYFGPAMTEIRNVLGGFPPSYYQPVAAGFIVLDQPGTVEFELMNCICLVGGQQVADARTTEVVKAEKKLPRGKHAVVFRRATSSLTGPQFRVKLQGSSENILFHSTQDLKVEMAKPTRLPQGGLGTSVIVYRSGQN